VRLPLGKIQSLWMASFSIQVTLCVDGACYQPSGTGQKRVIS